MIDEQTEELVSLYVMGLLTPEEERAFAPRLAEPEVAALVAQLEDAAAALALEAPTHIPPPEVKARILREIEKTKQIAEMPRRPGSGWIPWAIAAGLMLTTGWLVYERDQLKSAVANGLAQNRDLQDRLEQRQKDETDLKSQLAAEQGSEAKYQQAYADAQSHAAEEKGEREKLQAALDDAKKEVSALEARDTLAQIQIATLGSLLQGNPKATAVIAWDAAAQRGLVKTANLPQQKPDQDYQLWIIDPQQKAPISAGVFNPENGAEFKPFQPISKAGKFAVSLEKKGGAPSPKGPIVLLGGAM